MGTEEIGVSYVGFLKKCCFWWSDGEINKLELVLEIELGSVANDSWNLEGDPYENVTMKFTGVRLLKFGEIQMLNVAQIAVYDISDQQLEGIKFRVVEEEDELFAFVCSTVQVQK